MATVKVVQIEGMPWAQRWDRLKEYSANVNLDLEFEVVTAAGADVVSQARMAMASDAGVIIINPRYSPDVLRDLFTSTMGSFFLGACDLFVRDKKLWWPRCVMEDAFVKTISTHVKEVDQKHGALVVGANGASRLLAPSLTKLGYKAIHIAEEDPVKGKELVADLKKRIFDVDFQWISLQEITQLPGRYSMLINTLPFDSEAAVLNELYFFNFLTPNALVLDLCIVPFKTPLLVEAERFGTRHLSGVYLSAEMDVAFIEMVFSKTIDHAKYTEALVETVKTFVFDVTPSLERFRHRGEF